MISLIFRDFDLLERPLPESPSGRAWFVLDGTCFPSENWFDFPLSVLGSACSACVELGQGAGESVSYFFDGSFSLVYRYPAFDAGGQVEIGAYSEDGDDELGWILRAETKVSLLDLRAALLEAARVMEAALLSVGYSAAEVNLSIVYRIIEELEQVRH